MKKNSRSLSAKSSNILQHPEMAKKSLKLMAPFLNKQVGVLHGHSANRQMLFGRLLTEELLLWQPWMILYIDDAFV